MDSEKFLVTFTVNKEFLLINPDNNSSPDLTVLKTDSPVKADVSTIELPSIITPSKGTFSPGLTIIKLPISTSSGSTTLIELPTFKFATSGFICIKSEIDFLDLPTAISCKYSPIL
ncbi:hypothetical protein SDC9_77188 [bioreactor metagenome]|uniref:Uncharacterized protein n=1 Tax=bioreactor metagenome TaxID=1076179 RepID=A0A644YRN5_9ZZZZ